MYSSNWREFLKVQVGVEQVEVVTIGKLIR